MNINLNELRIGNWVKDGINERQVQAWMFIKLDKGFQPILITPDILEGCDFDYDGEQKWFSSDIGYIVKCEGGYTLPDSDGEPSIDYVLKYLHQLQNYFFAITGVELPYKRV